MDNRKNEKQFDDIVDGEADEFESVCSQCTADMNMDDDEIDICNGTDYRAFMVSDNEEDEVCTNQVISMYYQSMHFLDQTILSIMCKQDVIAGILIECNDSIEELLNYVFKV